MSTWTRAEMLRDAAEVEQEARDMAADQMRAAEWEAAQEWEDDTPTKAELEREEFENWRWDVERGWRP